MLKLKLAAGLIGCLAATSMLWPGFASGLGLAPVPASPASATSAGAFSDPAGDVGGGWCSVTGADYDAFAPSTWKIVADLGARPVAAAGADRDPQGLDAAPNGVDLEASSGDTALGADAPAGSDTAPDTGAEPLDDDDAAPGDAPQGVAALDVATVTAAVETASVNSDADDPAIWIHPTDPSQSLVIGTDKSYGLFTWDLAGRQVQVIPGGQPNNVDVRYGFPLRGQPVDIVVTGNESGNRLQIYKVDPATRQLVNIGGPGIQVGVNPTYGFCLYHSPTTGRFHGFINDKDGRVEQWELEDLGGVVSGRRVRSFDVGTQTEGCAADDQTGDFYIGEEGVGFYKYGAEPGAGSTRIQVDNVSGPNLDADVEGIAIYYGPNGGGYLLVSSQGDSTFAVYNRKPPHAFVTSFTIGAGNGIDAVGSTDGIDVTNAGLGGNFAQGLFVAHDGSNDRGANNYKLVRWADIARSASPPLLIDTASYNPRGQAAPLPTAPAGNPTNPPATSAPPTNTPRPGATSTPPGASESMAMAPGESAIVSCPGGRLTIKSQSAGQIELACEAAAAPTLPPTATAGVQPTATRTATSATQPTAARTATPTTRPAPTSTPPGASGGNPLPGPQDPPNGASPFNARRIPVELQAWWAPVFGHIHAAAMLPLGQDVSGTLNFDVRIVLHDNPSHLFELRIDTDQGVFKRIPLNLDCPYDGRTSTNCAFNVPVSLDTTDMGSGWREIRIRATVDTVDGKRFLNSSGIPINVVNGGGGGGGGYDRWCNNTSLIGRGWYDGFGYTNAIVECVPLAPISGVHTFSVRSQKDSGHLQVALDKSHYIPPVGSWAEVQPSAGQILYDRDGNHDSFFPVTLDTTKLANGWHSLAVTSTGTKSSTSDCDFCGGTQNKPAGVAKFWFYVQN